MISLTYIFMIVIFAIILGVAIFYGTRENLDIPEKVFDESLEKLLEKPEFVQVKKDVDDIVNIYIQQYELYKGIERPMAEFDKREGELQHDLIKHLNELKKDGFVTDEEYTGILSLPFYKSLADEKVSLEKVGGNDYYATFQKMRKRYTVGHSKFPCKFSVPYKKDTNYYKKI